MTKRRPETCSVPTQTEFGDSKRAWYQRESRAAQLLDSVFREFVNERAFPVIDRGQVRGYIPGIQAELSGPFHQREQIRTAQQRLGWHAASQDAQAPEWAPVDNGDTCSAVRGDAGGGVARAASSNNDDVIGHVSAPDVKFPVRRSRTASESTNRAIAGQEKMAQMPQPSTHPSDVANGHCVFAASSRRRMKFRRSSGIVA